MGKPMVVVVNSTLMGDHQQELAHALAEKVSTCVFSEPLLRLLLIISTLLEQ